MRALFIAALLATALSACKKEEQPVIVVEPTPPVVVPDPTPPVVVPDPAPAEEKK